MANIKERMMHDAMGSAMAVGYLGAMAETLPIYLEQVDRITPDTPGIEDPASLRACGNDMDDAPSMVSHSLEYVAKSGILSADPSAALADLASRYDAMLPLSSAELEWAKGHMALSDLVKFPQGLREEGEVQTVGGRIHRVTGESLVRRWWDWQRGVGEFEGNSTNLLARAVVREAVAILPSMDDMDLAIDPLNSDFYGRRQR